jgi:fucose permease
MGSYGGTLLGRIFLAEPTFRLGERRMLLVYSAIIACLQLVFWLAPNIAANVVALSLMGFFGGPFFATVSSKAFIIER